MQGLGRHVLAEFYGYSASLLDIPEKIAKIMKEAAILAGAEILEVVFHKFAPQGVSGVVVISESHLAIHTWPEYGYAAVDIFTCGTAVDPWVSCNHLKEHLEAKQVTAKEIRRGMAVIPKNMERGA